MMKRLVALVNDEARSIQERLFIVFAVHALTATLLLFLAGVCIGESAVDLAALGTGFVVMCILAWVAVRYKKIQMVAAIISALLIFLLLPLTFFTGGGINGGTPIWFILTLLFISVILIGKTRVVFQACEILVGTCCYLLAYLNPSWITEHDRAGAYIDAYVSLVLVCSLMSVMVWLPIRILTGEMEKSQKKSEEIEELNRTQNRFFSSMSHEIRTPINTIIGLNEMILREDISDEVAEDARNIESASKILLSIINDILDMSKIESGNMEIVLAPYDVANMLSEIVNMVCVRAAEKGLQFGVDVDPSLPSRMFSDEVRIKQILINLLNNAVKYTQEGRVSLSVHCRETEKGRVLVTYSVEDTGMGIRKESIPHLFDAFRREDVEKNKYIEGTGLGLSIVRQLVDLLGGNISVNSVYTKGSSFVVSIEQEVVDADVIGEFDPAKVLQGADREVYRQSFEAPDARVLIVDDNSVNLLVASKLLRETQVQVDTAESGQACLDLAWRVHYDVIFMDHMMPEMDGIACLHALREQSGGLNRDTPVVALTANAGSQNQVLYRREGFDAYLVKPVEASLLEKTLLELLPEELVRVKIQEEDTFSVDDIVWEMRRDIPLMITTDSLSDLPEELLEDLQIPVLPYRVYINDGVFWDGVEAEGDVVIRYLQDKMASARSEAPGVPEYEEFFSRQLTGAQHMIHVSIAKSISRGYENASEASLAFYNVNVFDSGHVSGGTGLLVLKAKELADARVLDTAQIIQELEHVRDRVQTSFVVDETEYLYRSGEISQQLHKICEAFMLHPVIEMRGGFMQVVRILVGGSRQAKQAYIRKALRRPEEIDTSVLFLTYVGMKQAEVERIRDEVLARVPFERVYLQKASPAISIHCGPGTFGLIYTDR